MNKAKSHVIWTASTRVIDRLKPVDKAARRTVSEPPDSIDNKEKIPITIEAGIQATSSGNVIKEVGMSSQGQIKGISIDADGAVYAATTSGNEGAIYKIDFSGTKINKTKLNVGAPPAIRDICVDKNKNVMIATSQSLYQLTSANSYDFDKAWVLAYCETAQINSQAVWVFTSLCTACPSDKGAYYRRLATYVRFGRT